MRYMKKAIYQPFFVKDRFYNDILYKFLSYAIIWKLFPETIDLKTYFIYYSHGLQTSLLPNWQGGAGSMTNNYTK